MTGNGICSPDGVVTGGVALPQEFPSTEGQREIWASAITGTDANCAYTISLSLHLTGLLDAGALQQALSRLALRHEALRIRFRNNGMFFSIDDDRTILLNVTNLHGDEEPGVEDRIVTEEMSTPFDLECGPYWRVRLINRDDRTHLIMIVVHHIICDGLSLVTLRDDLASLYTETVNGNRSSAEIGSSYSRFAMESAELLKNGLSAESENYWLDIYKGKVPEAGMNTDHPRPMLRTYKASSVTRTIAPEAAIRLRQFAVDNNVSLFAVLFAAQCVIYRKWCGNDEVVIGVPFLEKFPEIGEVMVGHCINFLPVLNRVSLDESFPELIQTVQDTLFDAYDHRHCTFGTLLQKMKFPRDPGKIPLVSYCFTYVQLPDRDVKPFSGLATSWSSNPKQYETFEITVDVIDNRSSIEIRCFFNRQLFDIPTIERFIGCLSTFLNNAVDYPKTPMGHLSILDEKQWRHLVEELNSTAADLPYETTLHRLIEAQMRRTPDAIAGIYGDESCSYRELALRAENVSRALRNRGVGPGSIVALCTYRSLEMLYGLVGILKSGAAYLPIDPDNPPARIDLLIADSQAAAVLVHADLADKLTFTCKAPVLRLEQVTMTTENPVSTASPAPEATPDDTAYVIYTSGSTGMPKGVMVPHRGICNRLQWMQEEFGLTGNDRILQKTPYTFDVSVWEFFWPLMYGATIVFAKPGGHQDTTYLCNLINNAGITVGHFVPSMLGLFIENPAVPSCASLRYVICSGEALTKAHHDRFFERMPQTVRLYNLYGPTEASVDVSFYECKKNEPLPQIPIGKPIANTQLYVLDEYMQPVPQGVSGELHIGGVGLAKGYLNRKELTDSVFVPDPFAAKSGPAAPKLYKTGDVTRILPCGNIDYLGRKDNQIKLRGFRIETGEIEECINRIPYVVENAVVPIIGVGGEKALAAFIVAKNRAEGDAALVRSETSAAMPNYMVPAHIVFLDRLPKTSSGKIDRKVLAQHTVEQPVGTGRTIVAPRNDTEKKIAEIWAEELGLNTVSVVENFFDLGGHSLILAKISVRLQETVNKELSMVDMFTFPTVATLADHISNKTATATKMPDMAARAKLQKSMYGKKGSTGK